MDKLPLTSSREVVEKFFRTYPQSTKAVITGAKRYIEYEGHIFSQQVSVENVQYLKTWKIPENSIFVCAYPKTGNLWCSEIVRNILYIKDEKLFQEAKAIPTVTLLLESPPKERFDFYDQLPIPRKFFITHLPEELFCFENMKKRKSKVVYVIRNPKDQLVSWFQFAKKIPYDEEYRKILGETWDEFFTKSVNGEHPLRLKKGEWYPDHILGWLKHRNDESFLIVEYEALKKDHQREIKRIADFLEVDLTKAEVEQVAENCSLGTMTKAAAGDESGFWRMNIRKGGVGGWKDQFTVAQSELMDKLIEEKLGNSGIKFTYIL